MGFKAGFEARGGGRTEKKEKEKEEKEEKKKEEKFPLCVKA